VDQNRNTQADMQRRDQTIPAPPRRERTVVVNWQQRPGAPNQRPGQRPDAGALLDKLRIDRDAPPPPRQKMELSRGLIGSTAAGLVLLAGCLFYWLSGGSDDEPAPAATRTENVASTSAPASAPRDSSTLDASGYIVAQRRATVSSKVSGRVAEVLIDEGDKVAKDQILARLDDSAFKLELARAQAQLKQAQANVDAARRARDNARPVFERSTKQLAGGFISAQAFDDAKSAYDTADSNFLVAQRAEEVARAAVMSADQNLADTVIRAPFDGVVTEKAAQAGEIVSPLSAGGGFTRTGICTIVDMNSLELEVDVAENFINRVKPSQPAIVRLNAYSDLDIPAKVLAIVPTADRAKATVKVRIGFKDKDPRILPEMGARVAFLEGEPVEDTPSNEPAAEPPPAPAVQPTAAAKAPRMVEEPTAMPARPEPKRAEVIEAPARVATNSMPVARPEPRRVPGSGAAETRDVPPPRAEELRRQEPSVARRESATPAQPKVDEAAATKLAMVTKEPPKSEAVVVPPVARITPVVVYPRRIAQKAPDYPASEKKAGHTGVVLIEVLVTDTGSVGDVTVKTSSGYPKLDAAAIAVAKDSWRFTPGTEDGRAAAMTIEAPVRFSLD
jgi:RND family efflux transporter MFP subunit